MKSKYAFLLLILTVALGLIACSKSGTKPAASGQPGAEEAVSTAIDAYVYGYSLVTMDMIGVAQSSSSGVLRLLSWNCEGRGARRKTSAWPLFTEGVVAGVREGERRHRRG